MAAFYKLVRNPNPKADGKLQPLHPRLVSTRTFSTANMIEEAKAYSSFSPADMKGMLQLFEDMIFNYLIMGCNVEFGNIGTFGVSITGRPVMDKKEIRSESIHFKDVKFRSSKHLRDRLKTMPVFRADDAESDKKFFTAAESIQRVLCHLENHRYITGSVYMSLNHCGKTKAAADLKRMAKEGVLEYDSVGQTRIYFKPKEVQ